MKFIILASAATVLAAAAAVAQTPPPAPPQAAKVQARTQVQAHVAQMFARFDANRDGFVTTAELDASKAQHAAKASEPFEKRGARAFERFDANRDGQISRQEWDSGREAREHRGAAGKAAMRRAGLRGGFGARIFATADADKDGRVSLAEAQQAALARFDRADLNRDGTLTREERRQSREQMRAQRKPG